MVGEDLGQVVMMTSISAVPQMLTCSCLHELGIDGLVKYPQVRSLLSLDRVVTLIDFAIPRMKCNLHWVQFLLVVMEAFQGGVVVLLAVRHVCVRRQGLLVLLHIEAIVRFAQGRYHFYQENQEAQLYLTLFRCMVVQVRNLEVGREWLNEGGR